MTSFTAKLQERAQLIDTINTAVQQMNEDFENNPNKMNLDRIRKLIDNLITLNTDLESQKGTITPEKISSRKLYVVTGVWVTGMLGLLSGQLYLNLSAEKKEGQSTVEWLLPSFMAVGTVAAAIVSFAHGIILDKRNHKIDDQGNYILMARMNSMEERLLEKYLDAIEDLKKNENAPNDVKTESVKNCARALESMPGQEDSEIKIPKDLHLTKLIESLPDKHPLKAKLGELQKTARKVKENYTSSGNGRKRRGQHRRRFGGENDGVDAILGSDSEDTDSSSSRPLSKYRTKWKELEGMLGVKSIEGLHLFGAQWNAKGEYHRHQPSQVRHEGRLILETIKDDDPDLESGLGIDE